LKGILYEISARGDGDLEVGFAFILGSVSEL